MNRKDKTPIRQKEVISLRGLKRQYLYQKSVLGLRMKQKLAHDTKWVFSRTACLGNDAFALMEEDSLLFRMNLQKGRSDLLLRNPIEIKSRNNITILKYILRDDIVSHILGQSDQRYKKMPKPKFILFDSYSDLTDVEFLDQFSGNSFFCHKSDLIPLKDTELSNLGLLNLDDVENLYKRLFDSFRSLWGENIKILFIHFPTKLEIRDLYLRRAKLIEMAIDNLAILDKMLIPIKIPEILVQPETLPNGENSTFPYHYSEDSKKYVATEIRREVSGIY